MNNRNPLATQTIEQKNKQYAHDCATDARAYSDATTSVPLRDVPVDKVEFIGGLWRIQNPHSYTITIVRDRPMILGDQIQHSERTFFKYYRAGFVTYNCYGLLKPHFDMIVAQYTTDNGTYLSYGKTIAEARAFLGIRLYDQYMDVIHRIACKNQIQKN